MKKFLFIILLASLYSCQKTTFSINESFIKSKIQTHPVQAVSGIKIRTIAKQVDPIVGSMLEISGYEYNLNKGVVIGVRTKSKKDSLVVMFPYVVNYDHFVVLNMDQVNDMMNKIPELKKSSKGAKLKIKEGIYYDYALSSDFYISYSKGNGSSGMKIYFWVDNVKYAISISKLKLGMDKFIKNK